MELEFIIEPTCANMPRHAAFCVQAAKEMYDVDLEYSIDSLRDVDNLIKEFRSHGVTVEQVKDILFKFGCYVGEVFVRNAGATWREAADSNMAGMTSFPVIVSVGRQQMTCDPIEKVFKRFENGEEDFLPYFYHVFAGSPSQSTTALPKRSWWKRR